MKAARLHGYREALKLDSVAEPEVDGPFDVIVKIGAAGLCRTDLHIQEGQWAEKSGVKLPYTPGHENAGWVHEVGSGVSNVAVGDTESGRRWMPGEDAGCDVQQRCTSIRGQSQAPPEAARMSSYLRAGPLRQAPAGMRMPRPCRRPPSRSAIASLIASNG